MLLPIKMDITALFTLQGNIKKIANKDPNIQIIVKDKSGIFELRKMDVYENVKDTIKHVEKSYH